MKCAICGNEISPFSCKCEACGGVIQNGKIYPNAVASFLDQSIRLGNGSMRRFDLIRIFLINVSIFTILINAILFVGFANQTIWFQFILGPLLAAYHILKSFYCARTHLLRNIRKVFYLLMISALISGISFSCTETILLYAFPVCLIALNCFASFLLLFRFVHSGSFSLTVLINTAIGIGTLLFLYFGEGFVWNNTVIPNFVSLAFSVFLLMNNILVKWFFKWQK